MTRGEVQGVHDPSQLAADVLVEVGEVVEDVGLADVVAQVGVDGKGFVLVALGELEPSLMVGHGAEGVEDGGFAGAGSAFPADLQCVGQAFGGAGQRSGAQVQVPEVAQDRAFGLAPARTPVEGQGAFEVLGPLGEPAEVDGYRAERVDRDRFAAEPTGLGGEPRVFRTAALLPYLCGELSVQVLVTDLTWGLVAESRMETLGIVSQLDVARNIVHGVLPGRIRGTVDSLGFQGREERLGHGIVVTNSGAANGLPYVQTTQCCGELGGRIGRIQLVVATP
jgi:hypothetical protein